MDWRPGRGRMGHGAGIIIVVLGLWVEFLLVDKARAADGLANRSPATIRMREVGKYSVGGPQVRLAAPDFNGDGCPDLVAAGVDKPMCALPGQGDGTFGEPIVTQLLDTSITTLVGTDLNNDGKDDLVATTWWTSNNVVALISRGDGSFAERYYRLSGYNGGPAVAKVNDDPWPDFVFLGQKPNQARAYLGQAGGGFAGVVEGSRDQTYGKTVSVVRDFNNDGWADYLCSLVDSTNLHLYLGTGPSQFALQPTNIEFADTLDLVAEDFNGDGNFDVAAIVYRRPSVGVLLGRGDGTFGPPRVRPLRALPGSLSTADFNADGKPDLAVGNWQEGGATLFVGMGDGTFSAGDFVPGPQWTSGVLAADFNRDGFPDLATGHWGAEADGVRVYLNDGPGIGSSSALPRPGSSTVDGATGREPGTNQTASEPIFLSPSTLADSFRVVNYSTDQGLPRNAVDALIQTPDGYLWIGTRHGVVRFDGMRFRAVDQDSAPGFPVGAVRSFALGSSGDLWVGGVGWLGRIGSEGFRTLPWNFRDNAVSGMFPSGDGDLIAALEGKIVRWIQGRRTEVLETPASFTTPVFVVPMNSGNLAVLGYPNGIAQVDIGKPEAAPLHLFHPAVDPGLHLCAKRDRQGRIWFARSQTLYCWDRGQVKLLPRLHPMGIGLVTRIEQDRQGDIWFGTHRGLYRLSGNEISHFGKEEGLSGNVVSALCADSEGGLWVGIDGCGLDHLQPRMVRTYRTEDGLDSDDVQSVSPGRDGSIWMGTRSGVNRLYNGKVTSFPNPVASPGSGGIFSVLESSDRTVWADGAIIMRVVGDRLIGDPATGHWRIGSTLYEDSNRVIHALRGQHWLRWKIGETNPGANHVFTFADKRNLVGILENPSGGYWIGSKGQGLILWRDDKVIKRLNTKDGLTSDFVGPVKLDPDGTLWLASDKGLNRMRDGHITRYTRREGLAENVVMHVLEDDDGWFWLNGHQGIHRVRRRELEELAEGKRNRVESVTIGEAEGMVRAEGNGGTFPNSCRTGDGKLWFPTAGGLVMLDPSQVNARRESAHAIVESVRVNDRVIFDPWTPGKVIYGITEMDRRKKEFRLQAGGIDLLEIRYTAPVFIGANRIRFRYRLEGHDADWREATDSRYALYSRLSPGNYRFRVAVRSPLGEWVDPGDSVAFQIPPLFYQTNWFRAAVAAVAVAGLTLLLRQRLGRQRALLRLEHERAMACERERIARDMHDDLGGSLTQIAWLSALSEVESSKGIGTSGRSHEIGAIARELVDNISELVWVTNSKYDSLASLVAYLRQFAGNYCGGPGLNCRIEFPRDVADRPVSAELRRHTFLILKEALQNVVKHSGASEATVVLALAGDAMRLEIADDGRGLLPDAWESTLRGRNGLANMRERAEAVGGRLEVISEPDRGVRVVLNIQLPAVRVDERVRKTSDTIGNQSRSQSTL